MLVFKLNRVSKKGPSKIIVPDYDCSYIRLYAIIWTNSD